MPRTSQPSRFFCGAVTRVCCLHGGGANFLARATSPAKELRQEGAAERQEIGRETKKPKCRLGVMAKFFLMLIAIALAILIVALVFLAFHL